MWTQLCTNDPLRLFFTGKDSLVFDATTHEQAGDSELPGVRDTPIRQLSVNVPRCLFAACVVVLAPIGEFHTLLLNSIVMWGVRLTSVDESRHSWFLEASSGPRSLA